MDDMESATPKPAHTPPYVWIGAFAVLLAVVFVLLSIGVRRSQNGPATAVSGTPFAAQLVSGEGTQRRAASGAAFATVTLPAEVTARDLFAFGSTPYNVIAFPEGASMRFSDNAQAGFDTLEQVGDHRMVTVNIVSGRLWVKSVPGYEITVVSKKATVKSHPESVFEVTQAVDAKTADAVTTLRVYQGSVEMAREGDKSEGVTVSMGSMCKVNDERMFPVGTLDITNNDAWESWNLTYGGEASPAAEASYAPGSNSSSAASNATPAATVPQGAQSAGPLQQNEGGGSPGALGGSASPPPSGAGGTTPGSPPPADMRSAVPAQPRRLPLPAPAAPGPPVLPPGTPVPPGPRVGGPRAPGPVPTGPPIHPPTGPGPVPTGPPIHPPTGPGPVPTGPPNGPPNGPPSDSQ